MQLCTYVTWLEFVNEHALSLTIHATPTSRSRLRNNLQHRPIENKHFHCSAHTTYFEIMTNAYVILFYSMHTINTMFAYQAGRDPAGPKLCMFLTSLLNLA